MAYGQLNFLLSPLEVNGGGGNQVAHFSQILVITNSTMDDINHAHPDLPRCKFGYVRAVKSCDVIKGYSNIFANNFG